MTHNKGCRKRKKVNLAKVSKVVLLLALGLLVCQLIGQLTD